MKSEYDRFALLERVEKAEGPDRELDCEIAVAVGGFYVLPERYPGGGVLYCHDADDGTSIMPGQANDMLVPAYTASMDAALALVKRALPRWWLHSLHEHRTDIRLRGDVHDRIGPHGHWECGLQIETGGSLQVGRAQSLPLAILAALLRAKLSEARS